MADLPLSQANAQRIRNTLTQISAYIDDNKSVVSLPIEDAKLVTSWFWVLDKFFDAVVIDQLHSLILGHPALTREQQWTNIERYWSLYSAWSRFHDSIWSLRLRLTQECSISPCIALSSFTSLKTDVRSVLRIMSDIEFDLSKAEAVATSNYRISDYSIAKRRVRRAEWYHVLLAWSWHADELREIYVDFKLRSPLDVILLGHAIGTRTRGGVGDKEHVADELLPEATCLICWGSLLDDLPEYDEYVVPSSIRRPLPCSASCQKDFGPSDIFHAKCCDKMFHKACLYRAIRWKRTHTCAHC